jgi:hypothetical protein
MRALTLCQPHATLVALGAKRYETRGWPTKHRGPLAIHAGKNLAPVGGRRGLRALCGREPFRSVLFGDGPYADPDDLPRGEVLCVVDLVACLPTFALRYGYARPLGRALALGDHEFDFGDYSQGRWAWGLANIRVLPEPVPARGHQGLWRVDVEDPR